jgi:hypothetical protein
MKIKVNGIMILAILFFAFGNSFAFLPLYENQAQTDDIAFEQKLKSALVYLESECGNNCME